MPEPVEVSPYQTFDADNDPQKRDFRPRIVRADATPDVPQPVEKVVEIDGDTVLENTASPEAHEAEVEQAAPVMVEPTASSTATAKAQTPKAPAKD